MKFSKRRIEGERRSNHKLLNKGWSLQITACWVLALAKIGRNTVACISPDLYSVNITRTNEGYLGNKFAPMETQTWLVYTFLKCIRELVEVIKICFPNIAARNLLLEWSRMILAFSLRPIPFHQYNYSFQFDADNNSRCLCFPVFFALLCFFFFLWKSLYSSLIIIVCSAFEFCGCPCEEVIKTRPYEAMISVATSFQDKFREK